MLEGHLNGLALAYVHKQHVSPEDILRRWDAIGNRRIDLGFQ